MHVEDFTVRDQGYYSCVVENKNGSITYTVDSPIIGKTKTWESVSYTLVKPRLQVVELYYIPNFEIHIFEIFIYHGMLT